MCSVMWPAVVSLARGGGDTVSRPQHCEPPEGAARSWTHTTTQSALCRVHSHTEAGTGGALSMAGGSPGLCQPPAREAEAIGKGTHLALSSPPGLREHWDPDTWELTPVQALHVPEQPTAQDMPCSSVRAGQQAHRPVPSPRQWEGKRSFLSTGRLRRTTLRMSRKSFRAEARDIVNQTAPLSNGETESWGSSKTCLGTHSR